MMINVTRVSVKFLGIFMLIALNGCGGEALQSQRKSSPITIDGKSDDWLDYITHYFDKEDLQIILGIANDDTSLNLLLKFRDQRLARMLEGRGVIFWFDGSGEKNKDFGIFYKNPQILIIGILRGGRQGRTSNPNPNGGDIFQPSGIFSLITHDTLEINGTNVPGFDAKADVKDGVYCFEISIPINKNENLPQTLFVAKKSKVKLGVEIAAVSEEEQGRIKAMMAERPGCGRPAGDIGGGGMRGGGMRGSGGGPGGGRPGGMPDMDGKEIWFTVSLSES